MDSTLRDAWCSGVTLEISTSNPANHDAPLHLTRAIRLRYHHQTRRVRHFSLANFLSIGPFLTWPRGTQPCRPFVSQYSGRASRRTTATSAYVGNIVMVGERTSCIKRLVWGVLDSQGVSTRKRHNMYFSQPAAFLVMLFALAMPALSAP